MSPNHFKRMKVKYATQALSHTVSCALQTHALAADSPMPNSALRTADFIKRIDTLFDVFNSSKRFDSKPYKCAIQSGSIHTEFLLEMRTYLGELLKATKNGFTRPPCFLAWRVNISAVLDLWSDLQSEGYNYLRTRLISQDSLENLFGVLRAMGITNDNPTPAQLRDLLKKAMISDVLELRSPEGGNCESDQARYLFDLASIVKSHKKTDDKPLFDPITMEDVECVPAAILTEMTPTLCATNIQFYVAGVCARKYIRIVKLDHAECVCAHSIVRLDAQMDKDCKLFTYAKAYSDWSPFGALTIPSDQFFELVVQWNKVFVDNFDNLVATDNLIQQLEKKASLPVPWFSDNEACQAKLAIVRRYFFRIRIYYVCRTINQQLKERKKNKENRKYRKLQNL